MNFYQSPFPTLDLDDQFILREQTLEDTEAFFRYYTDPEVGKYILATKPATLLDASREVQSKAFIGPSQEKAITK